MWVPSEGAVVTYITGLTSSNQFCLKFYSKVVNPLVNESSASIYVKDTSMSSTVYTLNFNGAFWTQYTIITAPLQLQPTDTIVVKLSAGKTVVASWYTLFDKIEFYEIPLIVNDTR